MYRCVSMYPSCYALETRLQPSLPSGRLRRARGTRSPPSSPVRMSRNRRETADVETLVRLNSPAAEPGRLQTMCCGEQVGGHGLVEIDEPRSRVGLQAERFTGEHRQDPADRDVPGTVVIEADRLGGDGHALGRPPFARGG